MLFTSFASVTLLARLIAQWLIQIEKQDFRSTFHVAGVKEINKWKVTASYLLRHESQRQKAKACEKVIGIGDRDRKK